MRYLNGLKWKHLSTVNSCIRKDWNSQETAKKMKCKL